MARYIDADKFTERIKVSPAFRNINDGLLLQRVVIDLLNNAPTADVVSKSEVDRLEQAYNARLAKDIETNADFVKYAKAEVAREIFALIFDRLLTSFPAQSFIDAPCTTHDRLFDMLDELQKKYTEAE